MAARDMGAQVEVFVLHRVVPPAAAFNARSLLELALQPRRTSLDGIQVRYLPFVSPRRERSYARWGLWAAPVLARALRAGKSRWDVIHAHNAVPAGDAVLRTRIGAPLIVSVHGGDVLWTADRVRGGRRAVRRTLGRAQLVLSNSSAIEALSHEHGAQRTRVLHLGTDLPPTIPDRERHPTVVSLGHLVARKRHADVLQAVARLADVHYLVIGEGPEREALEKLAEQLGVSERVEFAGQLAPGAALVRARGAWLMAMPSTQEAFGVAYVEAMAAAVPAIGAVGEAGPAEIAAAGGGIELVRAGDIDALSELIGRLLGDRDQLSQLGAAARANVEANFTWERCGAATLAAYRDVRR